MRTSRKLILNITNFDVPYYYSKAEFLSVYGKQSDVCNISNLTIANVYPQVVQAVNFYSFGMVIINGLTIKDINQIQNALLYFNSVLNVTMTNVYIVNLTDFEYSEKALFSQVLSTVISNYVISNMTVLNCDLKTLLIFKAESMLNSFKLVGYYMANTKTLVATPSIYLTKVGVVSINNTQFVN